MKSELIASCVLASGDFAMHWRHWGFVGVDVGASARALNKSDDRVQLRSFPLYLSPQASQAGGKGVRRHLRGAVFRSDPGRVFGLLLPEPVLGVGRERRRRCLLALTSFVPVPAEAGFIDAGWEPVLIAEAKPSRRKVASPTCSTTVDSAAAGAATTAGPWTSARRAAPRS